MGMLEGLISGFTFAFVAGVVIWLYVKVRYRGYMLLEEGQTWDCPKCMMQNEAHIFKCKRCGTRRPKNLPEVALGGRTPKKGQDKKDDLYRLTPHYEPPSKSTAGKITVSSPSTNILSLSAQGWFDKGVSLFKAGSYKEAVDSYNNAIGLDPNYALAYYYRAAAYNKLGEKTKTLHDLKTAARLGHEKSQKLLKSKGIDW